MGQFLNSLYLSIIAVFLCSASLLQTEETKIFVMTWISQMQQSQHDSRLRAHSDYETLTRLIKLITTEPEAANFNNRLGCHCFVIMIHARQIYFI